MMGLKGVGDRVLGCHLASGTASLGQGRVLGLGGHSCRVQHACDQCPPDETDS